MRRTIAIALIGSVAALAAGCSSDDDSAAEPATPTATALTATAPSTSPPPGTDTAPAAEGPEGAVRAFVDAMNRNDADAIRAAFAGDGCYAYGEGACNGGDALQSWLDSDIITPRTAVEIGDLATNGDTVTLTGRWGTNGTPANPANYTFTVNDAGLITEWRLS